MENIFDDPPAVQPKRNKQELIRLYRENVSKLGNDIFNGMSDLTDLQRQLDIIETNQAKVKESLTTTLDSSITGIVNDFKSLLINIDAVEEVAVYCIEDEKGERHYEHIKNGLNAEGLLAVAKKYPLAQVVDVYVKKVDALPWKYQLDKLLSLRAKYNNLNNQTI